MRVTLTISPFPRQHHNGPGVHKRLELTTIDSFDCVKFDALVRVDPSGCWLWTGPQNHQGYGLYHYKRKRVFAHRFQFLRLKGILGELTVDHTCCVRLCVNPNHLEAVTRKENVLRMHDRTPLWKCGQFLWHVPCQCHPSVGVYLPRTSR